MTEKRLFAAIAQAKAISRRTGATLYICEDAEHGRFPISTRPTLHRIITVTDGSITDVAPWYAMRLRDAALAAAQA